MKFLVEFTLNVPPGTPDSLRQERNDEEAEAAASLAQQGKLARLWRRPDGTAVGLYRAETAAELGGLLAALPLAAWLQVTVTALEPHPNDPGEALPA